MFIDSTRERTMTLFPKLTRLTLQGRKTREIGKHWVETVSLTDIGPIVGKQSSCMPLKNLGEIDSRVLETQALCQLFVWFSNLEQEQNKTKRL